MAQPRRGAVGNKGKHQQEPLTDVGCHLHDLRTTCQSANVNGRSAWTWCVRKTALATTAFQDKQKNACRKYEEWMLTQTAGEWLPIGTSERGTLSQSSAVLPISKRLAAKAQSLVSSMRGCRRKASRSSTHSMATVQSPATIKCGPCQSPIGTPLATVRMSHKPCAALSGQVEIKGLATWSITRAVQRITRGSEAEWPENVRAHTYTQTQTHNHAASAGVSTAV